MKPPRRSRLVRASAPLCYSIALMRSATTDPSVTSSQETLDRAPRFGAILWISAVQFFVAQAVVQSAWETPFSLSENFISDLGNTECGPSSGIYVCSPWHVWMNISFVVLGLQILAGPLIRARFPAGVLRTVGLGLLAVAGVGVILVGLFPENVEATMHRVGAAANFLAGNLGMCVLGIALWRAGRRRGLGAYSFASGAVGLLATWLFVSDVYLGLGIGGMERVAAYPLTVWLIVTGIASVLALSDGAER